MTSGVLSDGDIIDQLDAGRIVCRPLDTLDVQPSSIDVHLSNVFRVLMPTYHTDIRDPSATPTMELTMRGVPFLLKPGGFVLGSTVEWIEIPDDIVARLEGRSSLGRIGLVIHSTAGYVDPGWKGQLTLEMGNLSEATIELWPGASIGQIAFQWMSSSVDRAYGSNGLGSRYQGQLGPTAARHK